MNYYKQQRHNDVWAQHSTNIWFLLAVAAACLVFMTAILSLSYKVYLIESFPHTKVTPASVDTNFASLLNEYNALLKSRHAEHSISMAAARRQEQGQRYAAAFETPINIKTTNVNVISVTNHPRLAPASSLSSRIKKPLEKNRATVNLAAGSKLLVEDESVSDKALLNVIEELKNQKVITIPARNSILISNNAINESFKKLGVKITARYNDKGSTGIIEDSVNFVKIDEMLPCNVLPRLTLVRCYEIIKSEKIPSCNNEKEPCAKCDSNKTYNACHFNGYLVVPASIPEYEYLTDDAFDFFPAIVNMSYKWALQCKLAENKTACVDHTFPITGEKASDDIVYLPSLFSIRLPTSIPNYRPKTGKHEYCREPELGCTNSAGSLYMFKPLRNYRKNSMSIMYHYDDTVQYIRGVGAFPNCSELNRENRFMCRIGNLLVCGPDGRICPPCFNSDNRHCVVGMHTIYLGNSPEWFSAIS